VGTGCPPYETPEYPGDISNRGQRPLQIVAQVLDILDSDRQGRGFAVVAGAVRSLAQRSAGAAKDIKKLIGESAGEIEAGTALANAAGATMRDIVTGVDQVTAILNAIDTASAEQASGIGQVGQAIAEMDAATRQNATLVEQAAAAAGSMRSQAGELTQMVGTFRVNAAASAAAVPTLLPA
jgi:methyl-accepting chemotaxis protein